MKFLKSDPSIASPTPSVHPWYCHQRHGRIWIVFVIFIDKQQSKFTKDSVFSRLQHAGLVHFVFTKIAKLHFFAIHQARVRIMSLNCTQRCSEAFCWVFPSSSQPDFPFFAFPFHANFVESSCGNQTTGPLGQKTQCSFSTAATNDLLFARN